MKKTFLARRNTLISSARLSWGAAALLVAVCALLLRLVAPDAFWSITGPLFRMGDALSENSHAAFSSLADARALSERNDALVRENAALVSENRALVMRAESFEGLLGSASAISSGILAGVVSRPPQSPYDTLLVAAGREDAVALGMAAFGEGGVPLGIVTALSAHYARVTLLSSPESVVSAWVGLDSIPLTLRGRGAGAFRATAPKSAPIQVGDAVFVPGPGALPVGTVARVDADPTTPTAEVYVAPSANIFSIDWVILRDAGEAFRRAISATSTTEL